MRNTLSVISGIFTLSAMMMLTAPVMLSAQEYVNTPVTVSKEKVRINGKVCFSHIVLEKQTLYSISKAYNVSIEEIYRYNPAVQESGLKKNSIIIIPSADASKTETKEAEAETQIEEKKQESVAEKKDQKIHVKKWYEDLDMIAAHYGVTAEEIMAANNLTSRKLSNRQKLIIPSSGTVAKNGEKASEESVVEVASADKVNQAQQETDTKIEANDEQHDWSIVPTRTINVTTLLPMKNADGKLSRNNMDFYSGVMLAVYDLAQKGINTDINIYDIADQTTPVTKEDIDDSDVIIGPISTADLTRLFQTSPDTKAVISPLDPRAERLASQYEEMIQIPTPSKLQYLDLTNWIKEELNENDKVFMFSEKTAKFNDAASVMKEVMDSSGIDYIPFTYSILEGRDIMEPLKRMMTTEGANRIYIASESEAFVNDVVRNLNLMLLENYDVVLYAPSKIRSFETIEVEHFHKTSMRVSLTYYTNYDDTAVRNFLLKYRALYNTEPSQFAYQGYDIAYYFISMCHKYGKDWTEKLEESEMSMLQSTFKCIKQGTGGYINNGVRRIVYGPNWTIYQVK